METESELFDMDEWQGGAEAAIEDGAQLAELRAIFASAVWPQGNDDEPDLDILVSELRRDEALRDFDGQCDVAPLAPLSHQRSRWLP